MTVAHLMTSLSFMYFLALDKQLLNRHKSRGYGSAGFGYTKGIEGVGNLYSKLLALGIGCSVNWRKRHSPSPRFLDLLPQILKKIYFFNFYLKIRLVFSLKKEKNSKKAAPPP